MLTHPTITIIFTITDTYVATSSTEGALLKPANDEQLISNFLPFK